MNHDTAAPPILRLNRSLMSFSCCTLSKAFDISSIATAVFFFLILLAASDLSPRLGRLQWNAVSSTQIG